MAMEHRLSVTHTSIPGGWTEERICLENTSFNVVRPAQPNEFLEHLETVGDNESERDPYWAELWPSSREMAAFVMRQHWEAGTPTLELGCGIGLVGLAASRCGLSVTFSDVCELAVDTAVENAVRNGFPSTSRLVLDWRQPAKKRFPLILAADVLYEKELHSPLLDCLHAMLAQGGVCWLGDPGRSAAQPFQTVARDRGYCVRITNRDGSESPKPDRNEFQLIRLDRD